MKTKTFTRIFTAFLLFTAFSIHVQAQEKCPTWGADSIKTTQEISLYREFFRQNNYNDAIGHWRYVFQNAPGARQTTHLDGVKMFKHFADNEKDPALKNKYIDTVLLIFDRRLECFGMDGEVLGRKGVEMVIYQRDEKETYETLQKSIDIEKEKTLAFIMYYYGYAAVNAFRKGILNEEQLMNIYNQISNITDKNVQKGTKDADKYKETQNSLDEVFAGTGIFNCENLKTLYEKQYKQTPNDKELWNKIYNQMRAARCADDPMFIEVTEKLFQSDPDETKARILAYAYISNKNFSKAANYFKAAAEQTTENDKKSEYWLKVSEIQQSLGDFESSRTSALKASSFKPNWGDPYLQIGDLYASSGPKCGSGTGFESQVVVWVAIDMYEKAKSVDASVASKANTKINNYSKYMPSKEECFFRGLKEGDTFKVNCWINETTKVRFGTAQ